MDKTLGISLSECHCLPDDALHATVKTASMTLLQHTSTNEMLHSWLSLSMALQSIRYSCFTSCWW